MTNLTAVLHQLEQERSRLGAQLENLSTAISALNGTGDKRMSRTISAAGRARIAAAQRARWTKVKGKSNSAKRTQRSLSAAGRKRIIAATKARWAAWRREQKKAA